MPADALTAAAAAHHEEQEENSGVGVVKRVSVTSTKLSKIPSFLGTARLPCPMS